MNARRQLVRLLQRVSARSIASTCRVTSRAVRRWASGQRRPTRASREALERYGIAAIGWVA